ncbi:MAG: hypothetical protein ACYDGM_00625 [Vulcanimicrobiaceae bacterium]
MNHTSRFLANVLFAAALIGVLLAAGCAGGTHGQVPQMGARTPMTTPRSVSPALIHAAPMAKTAMQPRSAMHSPPTTAVDIRGMSWTQIPGAASQVAAAPDGSLWVLSTAPSGPDKYIWHYAGGTWTNIAGLASQLAVAPNGTLYAINSGGGTYAYSGGSWSALGGGASGITTASDGSIYVLSNGGTAGSDQAIWHNVGGTWSQVPGSGVAIAGSFDTGSHTLPGGTVAPGGLYIVNAHGAIYYENTGGTFATLPANVSALAPTQSGGVFGLGYPANSGGNTIYYYNLNNAASGWSTPGGAGVSFSSNAGELYVIGASGAIYASPDAGRAQQIFVSSSCSLSVSDQIVASYSATGTGSISPLTTIVGASTQLAGPKGVAVDTSGNIWVTDLHTPAITEYAAGSNGNMAPIATISGASTTLYNPDGIAVDSSGNIYVVDRAMNAVDVFAAGSNGNVAPTRRIQGSSTTLITPNAISVDSSGNMWVSMDSAIVGFPAGTSGNVAPSADITGSNTLLNTAEGIVVSPSGFVIVANMGSNSVEVFGPSSSGNVAPAHVLSGASAGLASPGGIALDSAGYLYVSNSGDGQITVYSPTDISGSGTPSQTIQTHLCFGDTMAVQ